MWVETLLLLGIASISVLAADYELILEDPDIFSDCSNAPPGASNIHGILDLEHVTLTSDGNTIHVKGNASTVWNVDPADRVRASASMYHFERGAWEPTVFSMSNQNFCAIMYGKNEYWYKYWTQHISNRKDVEQKCLNTPGTVFVLEPFDLKITLNNIRGTTLSGRYKMVIMLEAFDKNNVRRPNSICYEIRGELEKM
ncbi:uncharacterized protein LOC115634372 [Scaptodrosophila lebanonensis]|uniref:Uncharacterized protein LOC115634372 n=1 Tax=Drosophila lebanonensis TaxID=7225 RepID=A0A6J2UHY4_DROLE|nr:uncharacterized protein LOC115634372 [Scaptodrosophila lebanonensis]